MREWLEEMLGELEVSLNLIRFPPPTPSTIPNHLSLKIANTTESCSEGESSCECGEGELLRCVAERVTWTHQRRRRRLLDRLKSYESGRREGGRMGGGREGGWEGGREDRREGG